MKEGDYPTRIQGCNNNSPHTYEREMLKSVTAIETSLYYIVYCREDTGQILLTGLHEYLNQAEILPVSQCGLMKARRPIGMMLSAGHFQQKYQKQNMVLNMTFVYSVKAFDTVSRDVLWKILIKFGWPARFIAIFRLFTEACLHDSRTIESTLNCFL